MKRRRKLRSIYPDNKHINEDMLTGITGGGMDNTLSPASYTVQGKMPGYTYSILAFNDTLQQKKNKPSHSYYIYPGCRVRGVGFNNPDKHYSGLVNRIVKDNNGVVVLLYILSDKTSKMVSVRADDNLELLLNKNQQQVGIHTESPNYNLNIETNKGLVQN